MQPRTPPGRDSSKNELTKSFGSKYSDADIYETLMSEQMPQGKAFSILTVCPLVPNLPTEKHRHGDGLQVWKNAAKYALNKDSIKVVSNWPDQKALVIYMQGLLTTALVFVWTELPNSACVYGQHTVFSGIRALGQDQQLGPTQSVMVQ